MAFGNFEFPNANTYDSDLREVLRRLKELIDKYNLLVSEIDEANATATDALNRVEALEVAWQDIEKTINTILDAAMENFEKEFDDKLLKVQKELLDLINQIKIDYEYIKAYIDSRDEYVILLLKRDIAIAVSGLQKQIDDIIEIIDEAYVMYNPLRGKYQKIGVCVKDLWESERYLGLTNTQMEHYGLTNNELAARNLNNYEFAINLKGWLEDWGVRSTYHAALGTETYPYNVDSYNLTMIMGTMTVNEFEALDLTNDEFAALNLTNLEYLSYGAGEILHHSDIVGFVNTNGNGLTNTQLSSLGVEV